VGQVVGSSEHVDEYWVPYNTGNVWLDQEILAFPNEALLH